MQRCEIPKNAFLCPELCRQHRDHILNSISCCYLFGFYIVKQFAMWIQFTIYEKGKIIILQENVFSYIIAIVR